jgi:hypothetical protein
MLGSLKQFNADAKSPAVICDGGSWNPRLLTYRPNRRRLLARRCPVTLPGSSALDPKHAATVRQPGAVCS